MVHPMKNDAGNSSTAKFKRMTRHYGAANPKMMKYMPSDQLKEEGPEDSIGFGVEGDAASARADRPARRSVAANPVATYKKGGRAKIEHEKAKARAEGGSVQSFAKGGAAKAKGTHVNVVVMPQSPAGVSQTPPPALPLAGMPGVPTSPPDSPPKPMMGPAPNPMMAMAPGGMPPGAMMPRKRGGRAEHSDVAEDRALVKKMVKPTALKRAAGGRMPHMTAGAATGEGRLEKIGKHGKNAGKPQVV